MAKRKEDIMSPSRQGFFEEVYRIVAMIPKGSVITYGMIAEMLGSPRSSRIVGFAMHSAPAERGLPCHRVVNREGRLSPENIFGGSGMQRKLLEEEGICFLPNGCIDLQKHLLRWE